MKKLMILIFLALAASLAFGQNARAYAVLEYFEDLEAIEVRDVNNELVPVQEGMYLYEGYAIKTAQTVAEIQILPNGSIIKLNVDTQFQIQSLSPEGSENQGNAFFLGSGRIRSVARTLRNASGLPAYRFDTPSAVMGVRGTDFILDAAGSVVVKSGLVDFQNLATGQTIQVGAGQFADILAESFAATALSLAQLAEAFEGTEFNKLDPETVPQEDYQDQVPPQPQDPQDNTQDTSTPGSANPAGPTEDDPFITWLKKVMGFEVGAITIEGTTYSKATIQPNFDFGDVKFGLYLPVIYSNNLFDPNDWYKPAGNSEWSFGSEYFSEEEYLDGTIDLITDIALKFKYFQYGDEFSSFYAKLGNMNNMSLGHGSLMYNFANDIEFPAVRQMGLNTKFWFEPVGFEFVTDNVAQPNVIGGRMMFGNDSTHVALSTIADLDPMRGADNLADEVGLTELPSGLLLAYGLDLRLFKAELGLVDMITYIDLGSSMPYLHADFADYALSAGFQTDYLYNNDSLTNYGVNAGAFGKILGFIDYRMEFQYYKGLYQPQVFGATYDRTKAGTYLGQLGYLAASSTDQQAKNDKVRLGIFGSAGFNLFDMVEMSAAYRWPWGINPDGSLFVGDEDLFELTLILFEDVIPLVELSGGISYNRTRFLTPFVNGTADTYDWALFDANTVVSGEVIYGVAQGLDLAFLVSTAIVVDENGNIIYEGTNPKIRPTLSIETRVRF